MASTLAAPSPDCQIRDLAATAASLRAIGRPVLADLLSRIAPLSLAEYSAALHAHVPACPLEPRLRQAFVRHWQGLGWTVAQVAAAKDALERRRTLQTTTHVAPSDGPTFFAVHLVASQGLPPAVPYLVGGWSGVPFANDARPGAITFRCTRRDDIVDPGAPISGGWRTAERARAAVTGERRLSLVARADSDALVFGARVRSTTVERVAALRGPLRDLLAPVAAGATYASWAEGAHGKLLARVLDRPVLAFDLAEIVRGYLVEALADGSHPLHRLLFSARCQDRVLPAVAALPLFLTAVGPHRALEPLRFADGALRGRHTQLPLQPEPVLAALRAAKLCPGTFVTLATLSFLNGFCCLGGVDQIEYLDRFRLAWSAEPSLPKPTPAPIHALTSGRLLDERGEDLYSVDVLYGAPFAPSNAATMLDLLAPQLARLVRRPLPWHLP
jgi:hypothetical protein